ncbi:MAG: anthranilate synthase component I family protein [Chitinophagales bacterium]|nr:anthranilate synthase component I family protein [Chitinophagales bacterium]
MSQSTTLTIPDVEMFKRNALRWAGTFPVAMALDSNHYNHDHYHSFDWVLAADALPDPLMVSNHFYTLQDLTSLLAEGRFYFGFISYDYKNELEALTSSNPDRIGFPVTGFFAPRFLFTLNGNRLTINRNYPEAFELYDQIMHLPQKEKTHNHIATLSCGTDPDTYRSCVNDIRQRIEEGAFYELNYCVEFFAQGVSLDPYETFFRLNDYAQAPFSAFLKWHDRYLLCASPERFLKKTGQKIISQPIKGTNRRAASETENAVQRQNLLNSEKERAENVMIVDLVRNDLSRVAIPGTVQVEELFGVYTFKTVNHLISTITAQVGENINPVQILKSAFPMGSMTGAPKIEVMKYIERYENFRRGLFSGSVGYFNGCDFDFNVVIRSILYNAATGAISIPAGGAITYDSDPEKEYEELMIKIKPMCVALGVESFVNHQ